MWLVAKSTIGYQLQATSYKPKQKELQMTVERALRVLAGIMILISLGLAQIFGQINLGEMSWLWLTAFIGLNLLQSGFTGFCPPEKLLSKMGFKSNGGSCSR